jgi:HPt (histidine-containing phosphotransfer) domain-containing protein
METKMNKSSAIDPIDYDSALERTGGDRDFLDELLGMYIKDFDDKIFQLKTAVAKKESDLIRELAHSLKGSSANLSLIPLQETFYRLETAGRENNPDAAEKILPRLLEEQKRLKDFLRTERNGKRREPDSSFMDNKTDPNSD